MALSPYQSRSVLVVDDQEFVLKIVTTMLKRIGFGMINTSVDGTDALAAVEKNKPDLIICDINMKPMDGLTFLRSLRESDISGARSIPLIFLTAETSQSMVASATELGCDMFLLKPISPQKLGEKISQILGGETFAESDD